MEIVKRLIITLFLPAVFSFFSCPMIPASASDDGIGEVLINNSFFDTEIRQAMGDLSLDAGITIICSPEVSGYITCELTDVSVDKALNIILAGTGFVVKKTPDYYLVCSQDPESITFPFISTTVIYKLSHAEAKRACALICAPLQKYVRPDDDTNNVCITAPEILIQRIKKDLELIDAPPSRILLDSRIVVLERSGGLNMGIKWNWPAIQGSAYTGKGIYPHFDWGAGIGTAAADLSFTNSLLLTLNLLSQNEEASIIACPQVMGQDGKESEIKVTNEEYFEIVTDGYYSDSNLEKIEVGTMLKIVPRVGRDNTLTLKLSAEVSDVIARGQNDLPVVTRRSTHTTVRIKNGGTAVVAGLLDNRNRMAQEKIPGLGSLPIAGSLFSNREKSDSAKQVAIFITARIIPDDENTTEGSPPPKKILPIKKSIFKKGLQKSLRAIQNK